MMEQRILIVGPSWVGDMVMAQTLFKVLKQQYSDVIIDVLAPAWSRPILERMPEVNRSIDMPVGHGSLALKARHQLGKALREHQYQQSIVLPNSLKSALVPLWAKIPKRTGWRGEMRYGLLNDIRPLDKSRYPLMIERFIALAYPKGTKLPSPLPRPELVSISENVTAARKKFGLTSDALVLALCPGAEFGEAKRWPPEYYAEVARTKIQEGWQVWLFGSAKDRPGCENIRQMLDGAANNLAGETSLAEAVDLLSVADAVISNDSGLMHVAAALGRNLVVVYGSSSPEFTPPLNDNKAIVRLGLECSPCFKRDCPLGHLDCLKKLEPERVIKSINMVLDQHD
jgi:heptosyltransferase-2